MNEKIECTVLASAVCISDSSFANAKLQANAECVFYYAFVFGVCQLTSTLLLSLFGMRW